MKKILCGLLLILISLNLCGCFKRDDLEDVTIYTTVYPIEYITERLYGENSDIKSIYPDGIDINDYELTEKQVKDYSKSAIFVYNGLTNEKQIARDFLNSNEDIRIIDVSYGSNRLKYNYGPEELWLSPDNYLTLATNVKNRLQEEIQNKFIKEEIENNYKTLEEEVSLLGAELRVVASAAKDDGKNVIIVADKVFKFLSDYGFEVIDISDEDTEITNLEANLENGNYKYILVRNDVEPDETLKGYAEKYGVELVSVEMMSVLTEDQRKEQDNYLSIMNNFMEQIRTIALS